MDLDLDELRATRILNGVEKKDKRISEKQAIKELTEIKELVEEDLKYKDYEVTATLDQIDLESLVIVLNLIEKQQKEIEELKKQLDLDNECEIALNNRIMDLENRNEKLYEDNLTLAQELKEVISVDKIKAKIEVMNTNIVNAKKFDYDYIGQCRFSKYVLQSLLEKE